MGRKSNDGNSSGGGGSAVGATVMGLRMIQCGRQTVPIIQPDGQVRQFVIPVKVSDLLLLYPHHFVSHATTTAPPPPIGKRYSTTSSSVMLPADTYLETGSIYVLLPLPRLFPSSPPPTPHLCSCFFHSFRPSDDSTGIGAIKAELRRHWPVGTASSSKISPEEGGGGGGGASSSPLPRRIWEPALEIISEDRVLVLAAKEEDSIRENQRGKKLVSALNLKLRSSSSSSSSLSSSSSSY